MSQKNGIGYTEAYTPTIKAAGASPGFDPFTRSLKNTAPSAPPLRISKHTATPSKAAKITMKGRGAK
jgi:hypothetical protein